MYIYVALSEVDKLILIEKRKIGIFLKKVNVILWSIDNISDNLSTYFKFFLIELFGTIY